MDRPTHPWLIWLRKKFGEHFDYEDVAKWVKQHAGHDLAADSLRLIAQGHRPPGDKLAFSLEDACKSPKITARILLEWPHYSRQPAKRAAAA